MKEEMGLTNPRPVQSKGSLAGGTDFFKREPPLRGGGLGVYSASDPEVREVNLIRKRACGVGEGATIVPGSGGKGRLADAIRTARM